MKSFKLQTVIKRSVLKYYRKLPSSNHIADGNEGVFNCAVSSKVGVRT